MLTVLPVSRQTASFTSAQAAQRAARAIAASAATVEVRQL